MSPSLGEGLGYTARSEVEGWGFSPDTVSRWVRAYHKAGLRGLEPKSRRPRRVRQPSTPLAVVQRILALREQYPRWEREKLKVLLARDGIVLSAKSIDRVLGRLRARGVLREPLQARKAAQGHRQRLRRPRDLVVDYPGALVQVDTKQLPLVGGKAVYQFGAVDYFTRKRVVALSPRLTSAQGAAFLQRLMALFPFPIQAVQSDGGSEFLGTFSPQVEALGLTHYFNRPNYHQGNGMVERTGSLWVAPMRRSSTRACPERSPRVEEPPADLGGLEAAPLRWNQVYETVRPPPGPELSHPTTIPAKMSRRERRKCH